MDLYKKNNLTKRRYSACVAMDIVGSETKPNQQGILNFLHNVANVLNTKFEKVLVVPFQVRLGDELIGVINSFGHGYEVFHEVWLLAIEAKLYNIRFGLGFGKYDTLGTIDVLEINGSSVISAFRARDKFLKNNENIHYPLTGPVQFYSYSNNLNIPFGSVNALIYSMYESIKTEKQQDLIWAIQRHPDFSYEEIAQFVLFDQPSWNDLINQKSIRSNISKALKRMNYEVFIQMRFDIFKLLDSVQIMLDKEWEKLNE